MGVLWEANRFRSGHEGDTLTVGLVPLWEEKELAYSSSLRTHWGKAVREQTARRQPSTNQEEGSYWTRKLPTSWSWIFQPPELWEINACCLKPPGLWHFVIATRAKTGLNPRYTSGSWTKSTFLGQTPEAVETTELGSWGHNVSGDRC